MRKPIIAFVVVVLLFVTVMPALASHGLPHNDEAAFLAANPAIGAARRYTAEVSARAQAEAAFLAGNPAIGVARRYTAEVSARARAEAAGKAYTTRGLAADTARLAGLADARVSRNNAANTARWTAALKAYTTRGLAADTARLVGASAALTARGRAADTARLTAMAARLETAVLAANPEIIAARRYSAAEESVQARVAAEVLDAPFRFELQRHQ